MQYLFFILNWIDVYVCSYFRLCCCPTRHHEKHSQRRKRQGGQKEFAWTRVFKPKNYKRKYYFNHSALDVRNKLKIFLERVLWTIYGASSSIAWCKKLSFSQKLSSLKSFCQLLSRELQSSTIFWWWRNLSSCLTQKATQKKTLLTITLLQISNESKCCIWDMKFHEKT